METTTTKKKRQKPTDHDIHLKYLCDQCGQTHWLSYLEASTKGYKVVCDCGNIFQVKTVVGFELKYSITQPKSPEIKPVEISATISSDLLDAGSKALIKYGFTKSEAEDLLSRCYSQNPVNDISILVKTTLQSLRN